MVGEGVLPFPRFAMVEDLLGIGLPHVNDGEAVEVEIEDLGRSQDAGAADKLCRQAAAEPAVRLARAVASRAFMVDLLVGGRSWELLRDDAAERQERPIAIGLGAGLARGRVERDARARLQRARGGLIGTGRVA